MSIDSKLYHVLRSLADLFNRNNDNDSIIAERLLMGYPLKVQRALIALLADGINSSDGSGILNRDAKQQFMSWLTDEVTVWSDE